MTVGHAVITEFTGVLRISYDIHVYQKDDTYIYISKIYGTNLKSDNETYHDVSTSLIIPIF